jgi:GNAT superfamily N-acetyltransferase
MCGQTAEYTATCRLLDGRHVLLRRIGADDAEAVAALHQHLSDHDRYLRFFTLSTAQLDQLVSKMVEPSAGRYALGAFDGDQLIGMANYAVADDPTVAEFAIVVAGGEHLHGVGTALLRHLAQIAESHGIQRFAADILAENRLMFKVLFDLGWPYKRLTSGPIRHLEIELLECLSDVSTAAVE